MDNREAIEAVVEALDEALVIVKKNEPTRSRERSLALLTISRLYANQALDRELRAKERYGGER